jgi:ATP-dependent Lhr-like helicase
VGTLNEDFAIESTAGDVFQLGNASWRVLQVGAGVVRVADAKGAPPTLPFWLGEAPARSDELSRAVSDLRADVEVRLKGQDRQEGQDRQDGRDGNDAVIEWFAEETCVPHEAAEQVVAYFAEGRRALGVIPTQDTLVLERFFDESGGMQLVVHAPFGSRVNKAWGLALRKRFCRQFNFELQAAANEDALLLSLGPQHSFPLADVFRYLHPATARDVLVQAFLDAPVFQTRWRWNTTISLAVPRNRGGKKVPAPLQRMLADDLMAAVFPDAAACLENIPGDREIPDHPLVRQTVRDCLEEAMDYAGLAAVLTRIHAGEIRCLARDTPEPSPLAHEILNAQPYAFLDDAPLEERRTQAVYARRATEPSGADDLGALDTEAIDRVRDEARPDPRDADELHDALLTAGFLTGEEASHVQPSLIEDLASARRAGTCASGTASPPGGIIVSAERVPEMRAIHPGIVLTPSIEPPLSRAGRAWTRETAIVELLRGRLSIIGPTTARELATSLGVDEAETNAALLTLESEGVVLRGTFDTRNVAPAMDGRAESELRGKRSPSDGWCDRRLLARIHRYTLHRLRAEIEPVSPADFMRFLFVWQHAAPSTRLSGREGLRAVIECLDGFELGADAWERAVLPTRMDGYEPSLLDLLCLTGEIAWARLSPPAADATSLVGATPIALFLREHAEAWAVLKGCATAVDARSSFGGRALPGAPEPTGEGGDPAATGVAARVLDTLRARGACFTHDLASACALDVETMRAAIAELVSAGLIASDGFGGLRSLVSAGPQSRSSIAGRWSVVAGTVCPSVTRAAAVDLQARALLKRYGIVFRRLLTREANAAPWRELTQVYRRLEARGEIRGGRFVSGMSGEQFALPDAVERLREVRRTAPDGRLSVISAADPLNLAGIITAGERVRAVAATRLVFRDGVPLAALEGDYMRSLAEIEPAAAAEVATTLAGRQMPALVSGFVGR